MSYRIGLRMSRGETLYTVNSGDFVLAVYDDHDSAVEHIHACRQQDAYLVEEAKREEARLSREVDDTAIPMVVKTSNLTDGSEVTDITLAGTVFHCVSEDDARAFLAGVRELVGKHTLESLDVRYRTQI